jgi:M6 family metalloprotease-like protein
MNRKIIFYLLLCISCLIMHEVLAVPAVPWPVEKVQPDGSIVTVYLKGDEWVHWMESSEGYTLMYDSQKYIVYAEKDSDGNLVPSKIKLGSPASQIPVKEKRLRYSKQQIAMLRQIEEMTEVETKMQKAPVTGNKKALCILMGFSDKAFSKTQTEFDNLMNQTGYSTGGAKGSVKDFYLENSYGNMDLTVTVVGPYTAPNTTTYYAANNNRYREFAKAAAQAADPYVNFADFAVNGKVETFHIIFAGYGDEAINNGQQIWSHKWQLASSLTLDGVQLSVYSCSPELRGKSGSYITYIGVISHELCHVFGSPDYYDTDNPNNDGFYGTGDWDLMAGGSWNDNGRQPAHINMLQKILFGWVNPVELTAETYITNMLNSAENPVAYIIKANANGEQYILENKQKKGFDTSTLGHGLLIYHAHQNALGGNGSNDGHPQQLYPVAASSSTAIPNSTVSSYGSINSSGTPFPQNNKTNFTDSSVPQAFSWATSQGIGKPITNITESNGKISFDFMAGIRKPLTITGATIENKVYDGTTLATCSNITFSGLDNGDELVIGSDYSSSATYEDANADNNKPVSISVSLLGTAINKYRLTSDSSVAAGNILKKELNLTGITANNKTYNGNTEATVSGTPVLSGFLVDDDITLAGVPVYTFADANAGENITVAASEFELDGEKKDNYSLTLPALSADITQAPLTVTPDAEQSKVYGTPEPLLTYTITSGQLYGNDAITGELAREEGESVKTYAINSGNLSAGSNYDLAVAPGVNFAITQAPLTVTPDAEQNKLEGEPDPVLTYETDGWKFSDDNSLLNGLLNREGGESPGFYKIRQGSLELTSNNYAMDFAPDVTFEIKNPTGITLIGTSGLKVYPNPSPQGQSFYVVTDAPEAIIQIFTTTGILITQQKTTTQATEINLSVPPGIYIVRAGGENAAIEIR